MGDEHGERLERVAFVDLDGTLTMENTFQLLIASSLAAKRPLLTIRLARSALLRVLSRAGGRPEMKRLALLAIGDEPAEIQRAIAQRVTRLAIRSASSAVLREMNHLRSLGFRLVLATAAPTLYAGDIARHFGMDDCLASEMPVRGERWVELMGQAKADASMRWLQLHAWPRDTEVAVVTDSPDDRPLLTHARRAVLQCSEGTLGTILEGMDRDTLRVLHIDPSSAEPFGHRWYWSRCGPQQTDSEARAALTYVEPGVWVRSRMDLGGLEPVMRVSCPPPPDFPSRLLLLFGGRASDCCGAGSEWICARGEDAQDGA